MNCISGNQNILHQIISTLEILGQEEYRLPLEVFNGSTIGQHFRHIFDFYNCLTKGVDAGEVDYASRERHPKIETDPVFAGQMFREMQLKLKDMGEDYPVSVKAEFTADPTMGRPLVGSTVGRELMFAFDHAVHHLAIIKIGLQTSFPQVKLDSELGVAPSTLKFRAGERAGEDA